MTRNIPNKVSQGATRMPCARTLDGQRRQLQQLLHPLPRRTVCARKRRQFQIPAREGAREVWHSLRGDRSKVGGQALPQRAQRRHAGGCGLGRSGREAVVNRQTAGGLQEDQGSCCMLPQRHSGATVGREPWR